MCSAGPLSAAHRALVLQLADVEAIKFGSFTLKSGIQSPLYIDLRVTVSYPQLLSLIASTLLASLPQSVTYEALCGVPYTALPFATAMSLDTKVPMLMRRKEVKAYGTKKSIEGAIKPGGVVLVVEDLVTSGGSVMETVQPLRDAGCVVTDVAVLLDRQQGAVERLASDGVAVHAALGVCQVLDVLVEEARVDPAVAADVRAFLAANQAAPVTKTYTARAAGVKNSVGARLLRLMDTKRTNLSVAADVTTAAELLRLAAAVGPHIAVLKTHADTVSDWTDDTATALRLLADEHDFLLFEDRKFADIGNTVVAQAGGGLHKIVNWADIINAHAVPGPGILSGLRVAVESAGRSVGVLVLAQMSSAGNLATALPGYTPAAVAMAVTEPDLVFGFIAMEGGLGGEACVSMTPGVKMGGGGDALGQQYATPDRVVGTAGSDVIIVGRGIYKADDPAAAAKEYREAGWAAYERRCRGDQL
ncbi:hypothetical protein I4F81_005279 [Pyropia yezoensis]|uniref:Uncharacterized protein n=1 Tax=Pyropia yezoensis TaxID=2788 RepID=A0ACC3BXS2_PYRYE|nr:hypothetical protein I4F81_005279 [Neopyropia yezoensis]